MLPGGREPSGLRRRDFVVQRYLFQLQDFRPNLSGTDSRTWRQEEEPSRHGRSVLRVSTTLYALGRDPRSRTIVRTSTAFTTTRDALPRARKLPHENQIDLRWVRGLRYDRLVLAEAVNAT